MSFKFNFMGSDCAEPALADTRQANCSMDKLVNEHSSMVCLNIEEAMDLWKSQLKQGSFIIRDVNPTANCTLHFIRPCRSAAMLIDEQDAERNQSILNDDADIITQVYEGGLKVWEASVDLVRFLLENQNVVANCNVLELGCGVGLPGICASICGAERVTFQDFNNFVLIQATAPTLLLNHAMKDQKRDENSAQKLLSQSDLLATLLEQSFVEVDKYQFVAGDWSAVNATLQTKFDVILTAETIYSTDYYERLHRLLQHALKPGGRVYVSSKSYYFGVGGGVKEWIDFVSSKGLFTTTVVDVVEASLRRQILEMRFAGI